MNKLLLTSALVAGLSLSTAAMAQDYDKKNTANLESQAGFSVLKPTTPIMRDQLERDMGIHGQVHSDVQIMSAPQVLTGTVVTTQTPNVSIVAPASNTVVTSDTSDKSTMKATATTRVLPSTTTPANSVRVDSVVKTQPVAPIVLDNGNGTATVEEQEIILIEPAVGANAEADVVIETKKVIGNTDTGATPDEMSVYLETMN